MGRAFCRARHDVFPKLLGTLVAFSFLTVHCTWTPDVKTPIHRSEKGNVALQTFSGFKKLPQHPHILPEALIKQILQGITQTQEKGILQELFISAPKAMPVFSGDQIAFLAPHIVEAFSKATSEELITFRSLGREEDAAQVSGTIAVFSPTIFFLTLQHTENFLANTSKMVSSSRNLQQHTKLLFSQTQAMIQQEDAQQMMKISPKDLWIAIDYAVVSPEMESEHHLEERRTSAPVTIPQSEETPPGIHTLQEQLQNLRKKVEEQDEEIRRLQEATPK